MRILLFIISMLFVTLSYAQDQEKYGEYVKEAWNLYEAKDFEKSAATYELAFGQLEGKAYPGDRYNAACSFALAGNVEKSFEHLLKLSSVAKYSNYGHITTDTDLTSLHADKRWEELIKQVKANKEEAEKDFDKPLVEILEKIYVEDQSYRKQIRGIEESFGRESDEMKAHWELINRTDSINLIAIKKILDERGWLSPNVIGRQGASTLFLVIQHSDLETQVKYLPMMRAAVAKGEAKASSLALLEDRVALGQGKRQIYGSQIGRDQSGEFYVLPLEDPENVDVRRSGVGLGTLQDYVGRWDMTWDVEKHKKRTAEKEAKNKDEK